MGMMSSKLLADVTMMMATLAVEHGQTLLLGYVMTSQDFENKSQLTETSNSV